MENVQVLYKINTATTEHLVKHLKECNDDFDPPLEARVNIEEYSLKLSKNAVTFEAWSADVLVGLVAVYFSHPPEHYAYITNVSILKKFMRLGVASALLKQCLEFAAKRDVTEVRLEVHENNHVAIEMYQKSHFVSCDVVNGFLQMKLLTEAM